MTPFAIPRPNTPFTYTGPDGRQYVERSWLFYLDSLFQVIGGTGVVPPTSGGTGLNSFAIGDLIVADTTASLERLPDVATGDALISGGLLTVPSWGKIGLTTHVSGVLPFANGGTSAALTANNGGVFYSTASAGAILSGTATAKQVLQSGAIAAPSWSTATYPSVATSTGTILRADGTNWVPTTATYPTTIVSGLILFTTSADVVGVNANFGYDGTTLTVPAATLTGALRADGGVGVGSGPMTGFGYSVLTANGTAAKIRIQQTGQNNWDFISDAGTTTLSLQDFGGEIVQVWDSGGNVSFGGSGSFGGGVKTMSIGNATTVPTTNPTGGGVLYAQAGALKWRGSAGTVTTVAAA